MTRPVFNQQNLPTFQKPKFRYDTNLLNLLGMRMFSNIEQNFMQEKPLFQDIVPKQDDLLKGLRVNLQFNPAPGYQLDFIKNPFGRMPMRPPADGSAFTWEDESYLNQLYNRGVQGTRGNIIPMPFSNPNDVELHLTTPMPGQIWKDIKGLFE